MAEVAKTSVKERSWRAGGISVQDNGGSQSVIYSMDLSRLGLLNVQPTVGSQPNSQNAYREALGRLDAMGIQARPMRSLDIRKGNFGFQFDLPSDSSTDTSLEDKAAKLQRQVATTVVESMGFRDKLHLAKGLGEERVLFVPDESVPPPTAIGDEFTTDVMNRYGDRVEGSISLDLGTGSGILAVDAGLRGAKLVTATDINPSALTAVGVGMEINGVPNDRLDARYSDGFNGLDPDSQFDFIFTNPPVQPETGMHGNSYLGFNEAGADGRKVLDEILRVGPKLLAPDGKIVTTTSSRHGDAKTWEMLHQLRADGEISGWDLIVNREIPLEDRYIDYIPAWLQREKVDEDPRIYARPVTKQRPAGYSHIYHVYELQR